nr:MAG TPA: hypothetical protein [Caudoviricetes sp.]
MSNTIRMIQRGVCLDFQQKMIFHSLQNLQKHSIRLAIIKPLMKRIKR